MTSEIIFVFILTVMVIERFYSQRIIQQERKEWTKAMIAKSLRELTDNEALEHISEPKETTPLDTVPMDEAVDDEELFDRHISAIKAEAKEQLAKELSVS
jgi:hypothetical protein